MFFTFKVVFTAFMVATLSWLSGKYPQVSAYITALPLVLLLVLLFSHVEYQDSQKTIDFAKKVLIAMPLSMSFYIPFLLEPKFGYGFWGSYFLGIMLLSAGFFVHRYVTSAWF